MTSGSHGKPYADWALPGVAVGKGGSVDNFVLNSVSTRLGDVLDRLFPGQRRVTGGYVSSDDEFSSDEEEAEWLSEFMAFAKQCKPRVG